MLILEDEYGRNLFPKDIILKPGATMNHITENNGHLTKNFIFRDHIVLIGGFNDLLNNKAPSLKIVINNLKAYGHINIITSVPISRNNLLYSKKTNFNSKLCKFVCKVDSHSEERAQFIDYNINNDVKYSIRENGRQIYSAFISINKLPYDLIFVQMISQ